MKFATKRIDDTHLTLGMLLHYLDNKNQFCEDIQQIWKKCEQILRYFRV